MLTEHLLAASAQRWMWEHFTSNGMSWNMIICVHTFLSIDAICVCVLVDDVNVVCWDWTESWSSSMSSASKNKTKSWVSSWFLSRKVFSASTNQRQPASIVKAPLIPGIVTTFTVTSSGSLTSRKQKALIILARLRQHLYVDRISSRVTCTSTCDATAFVKQTAAVR